jgi:fatty-acid desaturase
MLLRSDSGLELPAHFSPIYFAIGNAATGFFVIFAVIASVVGMAAALAGFHHFRAWSHESLPAAASSAFIAWMLTLLAMGYVHISTQLPTITRLYTSRH